MSDLVAIVYPSEARAEEIRQRLFQLQKEYVIELGDAVIATKADKLSRSAIARNIQAICRALAVQPWEVIPFSAEDGTGRDRILEMMESFIPAASAEPVQE